MNELVLPAARVVTPAMALKYFESSVSKLYGVFGKTLYPNQVLICRNILKAYCNGRRFAFVEAPTGSGKSIIEMAISLSFEMAKNEVIPKAPDSLGTAAMVTVPTRELQRQFVNDYTEVERVRVMMGMSNFACTALKDYVHGMTLNGLQSPVTKCSDSVCQSNDKNPIYDSHLMDLQTWSEWEGAVLKDLPPPHMDDFKFTIRNFADIGDRGYSGLTNKALKKMCIEDMTCPYYHARERALSSDITVMSLQGYLAYNTFIGHLGMFAPRTFVSFDECHRADGIIRGFFTLDKSQSSLNKLYTKILGVEGGEVNFRSVKTDAEVSDWTEEDAIRVAKYLFEVVKAALKALMAERGIADVTALVAAVQSGMVDLDSDEVLSTVLKDWLSIKEALKYADVSASKREFLFRVTDKETRKGRGKVFTESHLEIIPIALPAPIQNLWGTYNLFLSATPLPSDIAKQIFRLPTELTYVDRVPDSFPVKSRPIFKDYIDKFTDSRMREIGAGLVKREDFKNDKSYFVACKQAGESVLYEEVAEKLVKYADKFKGESGLVFVNGYKMAEAIGRYLAGDGRFIVATSSETNVDGIRDHKARVDAGGVSWLVSAGTKEGYDFKDKYCRVQVFVKVPYPPMDALMTALNKKYKGYYAASVIQTLRQQYGRGMRGVNDYCVTIVLDEMFEKIISDPVYAGKLPKEFHQAIQKDKSWRDVVIDSEKISY